MEEDEVAGLREAKEHRWWKVESGRTARASEMAAHKVTEVRRECVCIASTLVKREGRMRVGIGCLAGKKHGFGAPREAYRDPSNDLIESGGGLSFCMRT